MYRIRTNCRACDSNELIPVFDLGIQPLANDFCEAGQEQAGYAPLKVMFCPKCTNSQLSAVVRPDILYRNYNYVTSPSDTMRQHFEDLWIVIKDQCVPRSVVEIGSNDGSFLEFLKGVGVENVFGIDPASNLARISEARKIPCLASEFDYNAAYHARDSVTSCHGTPSVDLIVARHVFCHLDNWKEFIQNCSILSSKDTVILVEAPYVMDTIRGVEFDQIYHEHLGYLSLQALDRALAGSKLKPHQVIPFDIHGGSLGIILRHIDSEVPTDKSWFEYRSRETLNLDVWKEFAHQSERKIAHLHGIVEEHALRQGKTVCGFGASAKSTVWINACQIGKWVKFLTDYTPQKIGRFSPGSEIPIVSNEAFIPLQPDYAILFAWNYKAEVLARNHQYMDRGGHFIIPVPQIEIVGRA